MIDWRLAHVWLRGYSDALRSVNRSRCYTAEAQATYARGMLAAYDAELAGMVAAHVA